MQSTAMAGKISVVSDTNPTQARINAIVDAVEAHDKITFKRLAAAAGLSFQTWRNLVTGKKVRAGTLEAFEEALRDLLAHPDDIEEEPTHVVRVPDPSELLVIEIPDRPGTNLVVRGPVSDPEAFARAVDEILRLRDERRAQEADHEAE